MGGPIVVIRGNECKNGGILALSTLYQVKQG